MSFDVLAPHYRWMELALAGNKLQRCRTAFLPEVQHARDVLILGEGNGRFLTAFATANSCAQITVVDASAGMLREARRRVSRHDPNTHRIQYVQANVLTWPAPRQKFDLIVSNFFFDCFRPDQLASLLPRLACAADARAQWLLSDFRVPARGLARWRARGIVAVMYRFFRIVTRVAACELTPVDTLLAESGFRLRRRQLSEWGLLHTDLWEREAMP